ncbi:MAG: hypothetical protein GX811_01120, partial [Lentisphaerae bacterium]|nr:hypothetical protein [Lentisphaerota bacterium]
MKQITHYLLSRSLFLVILCALISLTHAGECRWTGDGSDNKASNPDNWLDGQAPGTDDSVLLNGLYNKDMFWDLTTSVSSWTQDGYTGTVTIPTEFDPNGYSSLLITGDCFIDTGTWTHPGPQTSANNRLHVTVAGSMYIGADAALNVLGKGFAVNYGPGAPASGTSGGGSYGGHGGETRLSTCYGSITEPTELGSGGRGNTPHPGGGAVILVVGGELTVDGSINADSINQINRPGSGGSIFIITDSLTGNGSISVKGGNGHAGGGGGRISIILTGDDSEIDDFNGTINASGGQGAGFNGAAGTIYIETHQDIADRGTLIIDNNGLSTLYGYWTDLLANSPVTYEFSQIILTNSGRLAINPDVTLDIQNTVIHGCGISDGEGLVLNSGVLL